VSRLGLWSLEGGIVIGACRRGREGGRGGELAVGWWDGGGAASAAGNGVTTRIEQEPEAPA
jgi:hypothetical protein